MGERETLTTLPAVKPFCCAKHTLAPDKGKTWTCGPLTEEDLGRMLLRLQSALEAHGPTVFRSGSPDRLALALIPEVLEFRAKEQARAETPSRSSEKAGELAGWLDKIRTHGTGGDVTIDGVMMDTSTCHAILREAAAVLRSRETGVTLGPEWEREGEFSSFQQWVNKASSWLKSYYTNGVVCVDAKGRYCFMGEDFMRARDENAFPVSYWIRKPPELREAGEKS